MLQSKIVVSVAFVACRCRAYVPRCHASVAAIGMVMATHVLLLVWCQTVWLWLGLEYGMCVQVSGCTGGQALKRTLEATVLADTPLGSLAKKPKYGEAVA